jgi:DNA polymerase elongation subunit (family B)
MAGISFSQAIAQDLSWMRIHDAAIYRYCKSIGKELPDSKRPDDDVDKFSGAYVMDPVPGVYDFVTVFDVNSLYPSCIRALNISIETYRGQVMSGDVVTQRGPFNVELYDSLYLSLGKYEKNILEAYNKYSDDNINPNIGDPKCMTFGSFQDLKIFLQNMNYCIAANGAIFTKEFRGVIPSLLDEWIYIRKKNKKLYFEYKQKYQETGDIKYKQLSDRYNTIQNVLKVRLNSLYGFVGTKFSRFYHTNLAEAVTATGQYVLKSTVNTLNENLKNIIDVVREGK